ncbi:ABC transporter substrate-binding protein [Pseudomonas sp. S 311-6]|nr:ABC transporter substrate-binding protein [Pseudomonas sp. S 311-6]
MQTNWPRLLSTASILTLLTTTSMAQTETPIRVGYFSQLHDAAVLDLKNQLPAQAIEYVRFQRYADAAIALVRGDIDASSLGYANLITEAAKNGDAGFQFVSGLARGAINLVCNNAIPVNEWSDLKGKQIGVVAGFPEIFLDDSLTLHGQDPRDVRKVNFAVAGPPVLQALRDGTTDCAAVFEPFGATAVGSGYAYYPPTQISENSFKALNNGFAVSTTFADKHPDLVRQLTAAIRQSTATFAEDKAQWVQFMTASQDFPATIVEIGIDRVTLDSALYPTEAGILANNMKNQGLIRSTPSADQLGKFFATR